MPKGKRGLNSKEHSEMAQSSQSKGKEIMSVELSGETPLKIKKSGARSSSFLRNSTPSKMSR